MKKVISFEVTNRLGIVQSFTERRVAIIVARKSVMHEWSIDNQFGGLSVSDVIAEKFDSFTEATKFENVWARVKEKTLYVDSQGVHHEIDDKFLTLIKSNQELVKYILENENDG